MNCSSLLLVRCHYDNLGLSAIAIQFAVLNLKICSRVMLQHHGTLAVVVGMTLLPPAMGRLGPCFDPRGPEIKDVLIVRHCARTLHNFFGQVVGIASP